MSKEQYRVWCPELGEQEDDCRLLLAHDHAEAAEDFVAKSYHEEAFDSSMDVMVRCTFGGDHGELKSFSVTPEPTVCFHVSEIARLGGDGV